MTARHAAPASEDGPYSRDDLARAALDLVLVVRDGVLEVANAPDRITVTDVLIGEACRGFTHHRPGHGRLVHDHDVQVGDVLVFGQRPPASRTGRVAYRVTDQVRGLHAPSTGQPLPASTTYLADRIA